MKKKKSDAGAPAYYTVADAAWILAVDADKIHRAIRLGVLPVVRRRSRLLIPATALRRVLERGRAITEHHYETAARLDRYADVPDAVLAEVVARDGLCFWAFDRAGMPALTGEDTPDRELAARLCAGCPVIDECLELDLRTAGPDTVGVWGALPDTDRRALHPVWLRRRGGEPR
jgi:WhiB family redox-sensing transcriptional regulator